MLARIYTYDQVTGAKTDIETGLSLRQALELAEARCRSRGEGEPVREEIEGRGVIFRNFSDFAEVVVLHGVPNETIARPPAGAVPLARGAAAA